MVTVAAILVLCGGLGAWLFSAIERKKWLEVAFAVTSYGSVLVVVLAK